MAHMILHDKYLSTTKKCRLLSHINIIIILIFFNACTWGYIEVRNQSDKPIKNVHWGDILYIGNIDPNKEEGAEGSIFETHYIFFEKQGIEYRTLKGYRIDAFTSATFIYNDSTKVMQTSLYVSKNDSLVDPDSVDAITGSTSFLKALKSKFVKDNTAEDE